MPIYQKNCGMFNQYKFVNPNDELFVRLVLNGNYSKYTFIITL